MNVKEDPLLPRTLSCHHSITARNLTMVTRMTRPEQSDLLDITLTKLLLPRSNDLLAISPTLQESPLCQCICCSLCSEYAPEVTYLPHLLSLPTYPSASAGLHGPSCLKPHPPSTSTTPNPLYLLTSFPPKAQSPSGMPNNLLMLIIIYFLSPHQVREVFVYWHTSSTKNNDWFVPGAQ